MTTFDELLSDLHNNSSIIDEISDNNVIEINSKRQFIIPSNFDTTIAYEGDINSQVVTFKCINTHDGHELSKCNGKKIIWKNLSSNIEGVSNLIFVDQINDWFYVKWEITPNMCTMSGALEIYIEFYDKNDLGETIYSWNTSSFSGLQVGKSGSHVGVNFPARNEILIIDKDTKTIFSPNGYNNTICNYGEIGVSEVYFLINRYVGKNNAIDILKNSTIVSIHVIMNNRKGSCTTDNNVITVASYPSQTIDGHELALITWRVPAGITAGVAGPGTLQIMFSFQDAGNRWFSNTYNKLTVGHSIFESTSQEPGEDWNLNEDFVKVIINEFLNSNDFVIDANY